MASNVITCPACGTRNRVPAVASGTPTCAKCKKPLPWITAADDETFDHIALLYYGWGLLWWIGNGIHEIGRFLGDSAHRVLYFWHSVGNKFLTTLSNAFTNLNLTDMETCYKLFRRECLQEILPELKQDRFGFEPEVTACVARKGFRIYEMGIGYAGRTYREGKKIGWKDGIQAIWCILKYGLARAPRPPAPDRRRRP